MLIERKALQTLLYTMLTCPCPVGEEHERALVDAFLSSDADPRNTTFFSPSPTGIRFPTPLHLFLRFLADGKDIPFASDIVFSDVLRYFGGHYHWERSIQSSTARDAGLRLLPDRHMFLPVAVVSGSEGRQALWKSDEASVLFTETLAFRGVPLAEDGFFALHLGGLVARLSVAEAEMLQQHVLLLKDMVRLARETPEIDCSRFYFGRDHREATLSASNATASVTPARTQAPSEIQGACRLSSSVRRIPKTSRISLTKRSYLFGRQRALEKAIASRSISFFVVVEARLSRRRHSSKYVRGREPSSG
jgi:hypothetical protein